MSRSAMSPRVDRRAYRKGRVGRRTGELGAARSAGHRGKIVTKIAQIVAETELGGARDPREQRADGGHGHDAGRALAPGEQAVHRSEALLDQMSDLPTAGCLAVVRGRRDCS
jgi:hypothetical protein